MLSLKFMIKYVILTLNQPIPMIFYDYVTFCFPKWIFVLEPSLSLFKVFLGIILSIFQEENERLHDERFATNKIHRPM